MATNDDALGGPHAAATGRLLPVGRRKRPNVTILDNRDLAAMLDLIDVAAIEAELRRRGIRYHVSAGKIYATAADVLATFD